MKQIKKLRKERLLSKEFVSNLLGLTEEELSLLEEGHKEISKDLKQRISRLYGVEESDLKDRPTLTKDEYAKEQLKFYSQLHHHNNKNNN